MKLEVEPLVVVGDASVGAGKPHDGPIGDADAMTALPTTAPCRRTAAAAAAAAAGSHDAL